MRYTRARTNQGVVTNILHHKGNSQMNERNRTIANSRTVAAAAAIGFEEESPTACPRGPLRDGEGAEADERDPVALL